MQIDRSELNKLLPGITISQVTQDDNKRRIIIEGHRERRATAFIIDYYDPDSDSAPPITYYYKAAQSKEYPDTCPHCGGPAYLNCRYSGTIGRYMVFVKCDICGAQGRIYTEQKPPEANDWTGPGCTAALAAWNMRKER